MPYKKLILNCTHVQILVYICDDCRFTKFMNMVLVTKPSLYLFALSFAVGIL